MKIEARELNLLKKISKQLQGIFTDTDLKIMFPVKNQQTFYSLIKKLEKLGQIERFIKGFYVDKEFNLNLLSQKICQKSYISFEYVLLENGIIGNRNKSFLRCVKLGRCRSYKFKDLEIRHLSINENLFFDFQTINGVNFATPEKAFLDVLYFYLKGEKFYFDIYSDLNIKLLNLEKVESLLKNYKNPKFIKFVKGYIENENSR